MRTKQEIEAELKASEREKAIARFCEVIADYGLPIPTEFQKEFDGANRADSGRSLRLGGSVGSRS
jgi:signal transduction histidine kinase